MNPSNSAKFGIAFALGLVVALAGATVYVKTNGLHSQQTVAAAPAVQQAKQPETLNAPKVEEPVLAPAPRPVVPVPATVAATTPAPVPTAAAPMKQPSVSRVPAPVASRGHYSPHSFPQSQSTIRVEVSQIRTPSAEPVIPALAPQPVQASPPIRTVDEYPTQPVPQPVVAPAPPPAQPHIVTLQTGTNISIRIGETLSTERNFSGDTFRGTLDQPIILDGFVIAEKGSKVLGKIAGLDKGGKFEGGSNLQLSLTEINTTDGQRVHIQTAFLNHKGPASNGSEIAKVGGGAVLGALIGGLAGGGKGAAIGAGAGGAAGAGAVMLGKGRPAVIQTETPFTFQLAAPTTITEHLN